MASIILAGMEAAALALVYPVILTITSVNQDAIPTSAKWLSELSGISDPDRLALAAGSVAIAFFILRTILVVVFTRWSLGFITQAESTARVGLFERYLRAPYEFHLAHNSAEIHRTLSNSLQRIYREVLVYFMTGLADAFVLLAVGAVLVLTEPGAALVAIAYFIAIGVGYQKSLHGKMKEASTELHDGLAESHKLIQQGLGAAKEVTILGRQTYFVQKLDDVEGGLAPKHATVMLLTTLPRYYLELALIIGVAVMSAFSFSIYDTTRAVGVLGLFLASGFRSLPSLNRLLVALAMIRVAFPSIYQVYDDVRLLQQTADDSNFRCPRTEDRTVPDRDLRAPEVEFRRVSYTYPGRSQRAIADVSFQIESGEMIGIVGPSGAGKSTLVDVLLGLLPPTIGLVTVDGLSLTERSAVIGYVPQQVAMLDDTLSANITFGSELDSERLARAIEKAQLQGLVATLPAGIETTIGEGGSRLSGGQRQRIGIARALYREPTLLVLDEATSALDSDTELEVSRTIDSMRGSLTLFVVAHRLSTVRNCDRLLFMDGGRIRDIGSFRQLIERNRQFRRQVQLGDLGLQSDAPVPSRNEE